MNGHNYGGGIDCEDNRVDFSNASLYLAGIQAVFSICVCACVSVLSCWMVPAGGVSAVRTLALCSFFGAVLMRKPLRLGRAHGVTIIFDSLQPSVPLYLFTQVIEQLIHTCTSSDASAPSYRRLVFHTMQLSLISAGFLRARRPMAETDLPFILTVVALLVIAMLPPPSVALVGPLCQSVGIWEAAERVVRAFIFSVLYAVHVYSTTSSNGLYVSETQVVVTRSASASIWVLGSHLYSLPLAILQCGIVIHARVRYGERTEAEQSSAMLEYTSLESAHSTDDDDAEIGSTIAQTAGSSCGADDPVAELQRLLSERQLYTPVASVTQRDSPIAQPFTSIALPSVLEGPTLVSTTSTPTPTLPNPVRGTSPVHARVNSTAEEHSRFGPRSFQNLNEPSAMDVAPHAIVESDWKDRAAEIADRMA